MLEEQPLQSLFEARGLQTQPTSTGTPCWCAFLRFTSSKHSTDLPSPSCGPPGCEGTFDRSAVYKYCIFINKKNVYFLSFKIDIWMWPNHARLPTELCYFDFFLNSAWQSEGDSPCQKHQPQEGFESRWGWLLRLLSCSYNVWVVISFLFI